MARLGLFGGRAAKICGLLSEMRNRSQIFLFFLILFAFHAPQSGAASAADSRCAAPAQLALQIKRVVPRSHPAFTEGLIFWQGKLYESVGLYGQSGIQRVDPFTGESEKLVDLPATQFGEGLAIWKGEMLQLTWKQGLAWRWPLLVNGIGLAATNTPYPREGWGISSGKIGLIASDGTDRLYFLNAETFKTEKTLKVRDEKAPLKGLNELEVVNDSVWANVWPSFRLVRIDPVHGCVTGEMDLSPLLEQLPLEARMKAQNDPDATPNGIAYDPATSSLYLTVKNWPLFFQVVLPK